MTDFYRVQVSGPWWRRKWQAEWPECSWAQRGYTRRGVSVMVRIRRSHTRVDSAYVRSRIVKRWITGYDHGWYRQRYPLDLHRRIFGENP